MRQQFLNRTEGGGEGRRPPAVRRGPPLGREGACGRARRHIVPPPPPAIAIGRSSGRSGAEGASEAAPDGTYAPPGQATGHNNIARGIAAEMAWAWALGGGGGGARICVGGRVVWVAGAATNGMAGAPRITKLGALAGRPETSRGVT